MTPPALLCVHGGTRKAEEGVVRDEMALEFMNHQPKARQAGELGETHHSRTGSVEMERHSSQFAQHDTRSGQQNHGPDVRHPSREFLADRTLLPDQRSLACGQAGLRLASVRVVLKSLCAQKGGAPASTITEPVAPSAPKLAAIPLDRPTPPAGPW